MKARAFRLGTMLGAAPGLTATVHEKQDDDAAAREASRGRDRRRAPTSPGRTRRQDGRLRAKRGGKKVRAQSQQRREAAARAGQKRA